MKTEKFKVTPLERAWILYDVGNSAFVLMVATLIPIFFNALAAAGGLSSVEYLAYWGYASSAVTIITAVLSPTLATVACVFYTSDAAADQPCGDVVGLALL